MRMLLALVLMTAMLSHGQTYPTKPIRVVVPFAAGSVGEVVARIVAENLEKRASYRLVVDMRPGAGGNIGASIVAASAADGYTLLLGANNNFVVNQFLFRDAPPLAAFEPVTVVADLPLVVYVPATMPAMTLKELIAYVRANPGRLNFASPGPGTAPHLAGELFSQLFKADIVHVPYQSGGQAVTSLLSGETQIYIAGLAVGKPHVESGRLRALAVAARNRFSSMPQLPTTSEAGHPEFLASNWWGLAAPRSTPVAVIQRIYTEFRTTLQEPSVRTRLDQQGLIPSGIEPRAFSDLIEREAAAWKKVIESRKIRAN